MMGLCYDDSSMNRINGTIRVGTRASKLALAQVEEVKSLCEIAGLFFNFDVHTYQPQGDKDKTISLTTNAKDDIFTDALDVALLNGEVDITIHSAKDLPKELPEGLSVFALTQSPDSTDCYVGKSSLADLTHGARVGTSSALRQEHVKEINPNVEAVDIRGTIGERLEQLDAGKYDGIIAATVALKRLGLDNRIGEILPWEATPLQGQLVIVGKSEDVNLMKSFAELDARNSYGHVYLVGAGPGDPELITVKGVNTLKKADCVFYDFLTHKDLLDHAPTAEKIYVGKRKGAHALSQNELMKMMRVKAMEGKRVVRLKGGDPLIFGRGAEEISYLREYHIIVKVIPGVSSATSIPSSLGVPLTARGLSSSVAFISGHERKEQDSEPRPIKIPDVGTVVFLMGLTKLNMIVQTLLNDGWKEDVPVMVISKGTRVDEEVVVGTVKTIEQKVNEREIEQPALIIVGQTVKFYRERGQQKENILYVGTNPNHYYALGNIIHHPMIQISKAPLEGKTITQIVDHLDKYHMFLFTSRFAVKYFFELLEEHKYPLKDLKVQDFVVIGKSTAKALREYGFEPVLTANIETSRGMLESLQENYDLKGKSIFFPRSSLPNPYLTQELTELGAKVDTVSIYQNSKPPKRPLPNGEIQNILFTSPSTVENFLEDYGQIPKDWRVLSKGTPTAKYLKEAGYRSEVLLYE